MKDVIAPMKEQVNNSPAVMEKHSAWFRLPADFADLHNIENIIPINPIGQQQQRHAIMLRPMKSGTSLTSSRFVVVCWRDAKFCVAITSLRYSLPLCAGAQTVRSHTGSVVCPLKELSSYAPGKSCGLLFSAGMPVTANVYLFAQGKQDLLFWLYHRVKLTLR